MIRILFTYVVPLVLPTLIYLGWQSYVRRRQAETGTTPPPPWSDVPWLWLVLAGLVLAGSALGAFALFGGSAPGGVYQPARIIDGQIVPGRVTPKPPPQ